MHGKDADIDIDLLVCHMPSKAHLLGEDVLLRLEGMTVLQALVTAGLGVATVLQRAPFLFQPHHLVLAHAPQVAVQLPHR